VIHDIGYGVGKRDLPDRPNLARILIGDQQDETEVDTVVVLETNLDDTSPEVLGYLMERLFDAGGLDVVFFPVQMKKGRPGVQVQVIGRPDQKDVLMEILFKESTTLGIRFRYSQRKLLERSVVEVDSPWGKIKAKKAVNSDGSAFFLPEYEVCRKIALENNRPLKEIFSWVMSLNK
ncbi:MAG: LarC family nickel insertion protein, partial [Desulfobacteraceae bacterium]|nr:LarC family nickel insertion protein [Desulfobacteraceae bacterium]